MGGGVEKCWGRCGENIREVWESVLGCGGGKGEMWGEVWGVWGSVLGVWREV